MAFQFPAAPLVGQIFTPVAGVQYKWNGYAWDSISLTALSQAQADLLYVQLTKDRVRNFIINGLCRVAQRGDNLVLPGSSVATYGGCDRIFSTHSNASAWRQAQLNGQPWPVSGIAQGLFITTPSTSSINFGTRIEARDTTGLNSKVITVSAKLFHNGVGIIPAIIILEKANAADNFSAVTVIGTGTITDVPASTATSLSQSFTLGAADAINGLQVRFQWNAPGALANVALQISDLQLTQTDYVAPIELTNIQTELARCQRYYNKSYSQGVVPGTITDAGTIGSLVSATTALSTIKFPVSMRVTPTMALYSPVTGAIANWRRNTAAADVGMAVVFTGSSEEVMVIVQSACSDAEIVHGHYTAAAEL